MLGLGIGLTLGFFQSYLFFFREEMWQVFFFTIVCLWITLFSLYFILEIGPVTITTDPKKFQFELRELYVQVSNLFPVWF